MGHQRLDLRKSLVDELFEELIQRHHKRVLEELKLDVEEFIAPPSQHSYESSAVGTPKSTRSAQSAKLLRCESMDFKDRSGGKESLKSTSATAAVPEKKIGSKLWQSARKCSEVIQKKLKKSHSNDHHHPTNRKTIEHEKPQRPEQPVTQVTRRGHRPLSAIVTKSSRTVIDTLEDDSDNKQEAAARRLLRSQIIKSFWEQHDNDNEEAHDDFNDNDNIEEYERL